MFDFTTIYFLRKEEIRVLLNKTKITSIKPIAVCIFPKMLKIDALIGKFHGGDDLSSGSDLK